MRAALVRVGIDQSYGGWNAPADPETGEYIYVPIPEGPNSPVRPELATTYDTLEPGLRAFASKHGITDPELCSIPPKLRGATTHLDPDFSHLTYGDNGERRGRGIAEFEPGDVIAFYAGLRPVRPCEHRLVYALIGFYRVAEVVRAASVPRERWAENAHLRRLNQRGTDVIVRAAPGQSGRLRRASPSASTGTAPTACGPTCWNAGADYRAAMASSSAAPCHPRSWIPNGSWRGLMSSVRIWSRKTERQRQ